ncbi:MAE_28990/MAE_18760 family HEPN-like nuclease [Streptomyces sp. NPDC058466]|uniref:MAE_28990/MAE_18760 family HEPN-like nuclease n=1 Tax=Streptomyces sp. NPDC058466 TaxID=3346512 RepID=UPI00365A77E5
MSASELSPFFEERYAEVSEYLAFLQEIEKAAQSGIPRIAGVNYRITVKQQRILYSSLYLQLYNLVEATVARCISAITEAAETAGQWQPHQLNDELLREWVRSTARTHADMAPEARLKYAMDLGERIVKQLPVNGFLIESGGGGNWDDEAIYDMGKRLGCSITITAETRSLVKRPMRDDLGSMKLVKNRRNDLAHGSISFVECADTVTVDELCRTANSVEKYLREVIDCFVRFVDSYDFLRPSFRPNGGAP